MAFLPCPATDQLRITHVLGLGRRGRPWKRGHEYPLQFIKKPPHHAESAIAGDPKIVPRTPPAPATAVPATSSPKYGPVLRAPPSPHSGLLTPTPVVCKAFSRTRGSQRRWSDEALQRLVVLRRRQEYPSVAPNAASAPSRPRFRKPVVDVKIRTASLKLSNLFSPRESCHLFARLQPC